MRYFVPDIIPAEPVQAKGLIARLLGGSTADSQSLEKLGGIPRGLPEALWPRCAECGKSQSLLAQFRHDLERLDLGRNGRMLFIFQCGHAPGMCSTWEPFSGANVCLVLEPEQLTADETAIPDDHPPTDREVTVAGWIAGEDGLSDSDAAAFYSEEAFLKLSEETMARASPSTRLGGVPCWVQSPDEAPAEWNFIGQMDSTYSFFRDLRNVPAWVSPDAERRGGRAFYAQGPNFGDGGIAYLFARPGLVIPSVCMLWQCG